MRSDTPGLTDKLLGVQANLHPVVEESEERGEGEGSYKDGDEAKLENHLQVLLEQALVVHQPVVLLDLSAAFAAQR